MPIYAYRCESCGFEKDALQKMSDAPLTHCPQCGKETFVKQVTAAGFQLKGSGWYGTDFRGGNNGAPAAKKDDGAKAEAKGESASDSASSSKESSKDSGNQSSKTDSSTASASASDSAKSSTMSAPAASAKPAAPASN